MVDRTSPERRIAVTHEHAIARDSMHEAKLPENGPELRTVHVVIKLFHAEDMALVCDDEVMRRKILRSRTLPGTPTAVFRDDDIELLVQVTERALASQRLGHRSYVHPVLASTRESRALPRTQTRNLKTGKFHESHSLPGSLVRAFYTKIASLAS